VNGFVLSDMTTTVVLAADDANLKAYWVHMCALVLRKIHDHEPDHFIGGDVEDEASRIKNDFEKRLQKFKKEKGNRRQSMFFRKKTKEEDVVKEATDTAVAMTTKELREKEIQRQRELEELQRRLDEAELEKDKYREEAQQEHERADREAARATEEEQRRAEAENRLKMTLDELREESRLREEALLLEKEEILAKLTTVNNKRRESMMPGTAGAAAKDAERWEKERKALQAKLDALMDALNVDLGNLEWDGTLEDAELKMKELVPALCSEDEKVAREAQAKFDQYDKVIRNHADYKAREEQKWVTWEEENAPKNKRALDEMKRIVPHEIASGISVEFLTGQCHLTPEVAGRIMKTKILQFLYTDVDVIAKTHIADLSSRFVPQGLDIREMRAVYACLPKEFLLDGDGKKKLWKDDFRNKLHAMTEKEAKGSLSKFEQLAAAYRPKEDRKAAGGGGGGGHPAGGGAGRANPMAGALGALFAGRGGPPGAGPPPAAPKLDTSALQNALASKLMGKGPNPMLQRSAEIAEKEEAQKEKADLLAVLKKSHASAEEAPAPKPIPTTPPADAPKPTPMTADKKRSLIPKEPEKKASLVPAARAPAAASVSGGNGVASPKKMSDLPVQPSAGAEKKAPPPMVDIGVKFNSGKKEEPDGLIGKDARDLFNKARHNTLTADEFEGDVPTYDFDANYYAAQKRKTWVDDGIKKLTDLIESVGSFDKGEGGKKTATFGKIYENFGSNSDMLVGILMRARKKGKIKYVGDMLFKGVHDDVKITVV